MYSIAAAAAATGLSETTVLRAIQAGRISGTKNEINEWQVDPADLHRLYSPEVTRSDSGNAPGADRPPARPSGRAEAISSRARLDDMAQAKRLAGLANSDQRTQQAARTRWWRLVSGLQDSFGSPALPCRRT
jgi:GH24 family phage-related lysozyme (muramidase)